MLLSTFLTRWGRRRDAKQARLEEALRCVVLAISARQFVTTIGIDGDPEFVSDSDVEKVERRAYLRNVDNQYVTLQNAKHAVGVLVGDGVDVGDAWRGDTYLADALEDLCTRLLAELRRG